MEQAGMTDSALSPAGHGESTLAQLASRHKRAAAQQVQVVEAALRSAFARMASRWPGLAARVDGVQVGAISIPEIGDMVEPGMFVALLEGRGDNMGVGLICPALLAGLVEAGATGRVLGGAMTARAPTRTDAALVAPMLDALLDQIETRLAGVDGAPDMGGYAYGSFMQDPRPLTLLLEDGQFRRVTYAVSLGNGAVTGRLTLILPDVEAITARQDAAPRSAPPSDWARDLHAAVAASSTHLDAVLFDAHLALNAALSLAPGDLLCIPASALETLSLRTLDGTAIATGRLGQTRGQRAVRLTSDVSARPQADGPAIPRAATLTPVIRALDAAADGAAPNDTRP